MNVHFLEDFRGQTLMLKGGDKYFECKFFDCTLVGPPNGEPNVHMEDSYLNSCTMISFENYMNPQQAIKLDGWQDGLDLRFQ